MSTHVPNRSGKGTPEGGRFAPDEVPAVQDADTLTLDIDGSTTSEVVLDPVADLYDKMTYDEDGYDAHGFNKTRLHRNGTLYDDDGYDRDGFQ